MERYLIPLAPYALLALVTMVSLALYLSFDRDIRRLKKRLSGPANRGLSPQELRLRLDDFAIRLQEAEERSSAGAPSAAHIKPSLNLNKRNQVIRMSRRGQAATQIAASLSLPRKQVELLLKIHNLASKDAPQTPA
jgi:hypothetical protein